MGFLDFFKKRKKSDEDSEFSAFADNLIAESMENDFLGKAAEAGQKARAALKEDNHDEAWGFYHEQKSLYMQHANRCGFTARQEHQVLDTHKLPEPIKLPFITITSRRHLNGYARKPNSQF